MSETPAETMRRAAALMRERAEKAPQGPWRVWDSGHGYDDLYVMSPDGQVDTIERTPVEGGMAEAEHIASWHPLAALAVARWLESLDGIDWSAHGSASEEFTHALRVARTFLGESAS